MYYLEAITDYLRRGPGCTRPETWRPSHRRILAMRELDTGDYQTNPTDRGTADRESDQTDWTKHDHYYQLEGIFQRATHARQVTVEGDA